MLWTRIKRFYNKEDFDYSTGYVDPEKFHFIFFWFQRAYQVNGEVPQLWTHAVTAFTTVCGCLIMAGFSLELYHAIDIFDLGLIIEATNYVLLVWYNCMTITISKINVPDFLNLIQAMKEDFEYICTKNEKYRKAFFEIQLGAWQQSMLVISFMTFATGTLIMAAVATVVYYYITHTPGDGAYRQLVFPYWAPGVDFTATPAFEIAFTIGNLGSITCIGSYAFSLQTNVIWIREITAKAVIIGMGLKDLLVGIHPTNNEEQKLRNARLINYRIKEIVSQHVIMYRLLDSYASVYKKTLMYDQLIFSPMICMSTFCFAEKRDRGELHVVMLVVCIGSIIMLFGPCYLCTYLRTKLTEISDICYELRFWDAGPSVRVNLVLIMQRCLRPLPLQMPGFEEVSLKTFSAKMVSAYSLFNMLRQMELDF